jgi:ABC-2 type transport system ATP-binding protein
VRDVIHELKARGTSVFLNSHLLGEVEATCDRVVFMKQGRVVHELEMSAQPPGSRWTCAWKGRTTRSCPLMPSCCRATGALVRVRVEHEDALPALAAALVREGAKLTP